VIKLSLSPSLSLSLLDGFLFAPFLRESEEGERGLMRTRAEGKRAEKDRSKRVEREP
jgi:hypothetical protein